MRPLLETHVTSYSIGLGNVLALPSELQREKDFILKELDVTGNVSKLFETIVCLCIQTTH